MANKFEPNDRLRIVDDELDEIELGGIEKLKEQELDFSFTAISEAMEFNFPNINIDTLEQAYEFAKYCHFTIKRKSGESSLIHPLGVLERLSKTLVTGKNRKEIEEVLTTDEEMTALFVTALLHDSLEDKAFLVSDDIEEIKEDYGELTLEAVFRLTKPVSFDRRYDDLDVETHGRYKHFNDPEHAWITDLQRKQLEGVEGDNQKTLVIARMVKAADIMHNLDTLEFLSPDDQKRYLQETSAIWGEAFEKWGYDRVSKMIHQKLKNH